MVVDGSAAIDGAVVAIDARPGAYGRVTRYALLCARHLAGQGIKMLVVACNTVSADSLPALADALPIPVVGVIEPGAQAAASTCYATCSPIPLHRCTTAPKSPPWPNRARCLQPLHYRAFRFYRGRHH